MTDFRAQSRIHTVTPATKFESSTSLTSEISLESDDLMKYHIDKTIGYGTFATVYQVTKISTGEIFAMKKILLNNAYENREFDILKSLNHPNIITLHYAFTESAFSAEESFLNLVMDHIPETLLKVIKHYTSRDYQVPSVLIKLYSYQLLRGLGYLHSLEICHRDIKPQNLLIDTSHHILKICDFGSAKKIIPGENNISYICSRYYRAPELIFGTNDYTNAVDI